MRSSEKNTMFFFKNIGADTLLIGARIWVGTPHSIERKSLGAGGSVRAAAGAGRRKFCQIIMPLPSCKLKLPRFPA